MKKILSLGLMIGGLSMSCSAFAAQYGMAGCGLGSLIFRDRPSVSAQSSAVSFNNTSYNQAFGISFGTSNCDVTGKRLAQDTQKQFIAENFATLSKELAQGDGETLRAFSQTFGCSTEAYPVFASHMKNSYEKIFSAPGSSAALEVVNTEIKSNPALSNTCQYAI